MRKFVAPLLALAVLIAPFTGLMPPYWITLFNYIGLSSLVALGLVLLTGVGGMTSFGQAAFVGFGAYTSAVLTLDYGISPWLTLPVSLLVTALGALMIGAITVRLSGHYLPLGTIAWGIALFYVFGNSSTLGAHDGLSGVPPLHVGTHAIIDPREYFVVVWIAVVLAIVATRNLLDSRIGRAIRALRRGAVAAESFGVNAPRAKLIVFVYSALLAGLAGWLYAHFQRSVSPGAFGVNTGIEYLIMAVMGGAGRIYGAILGAATVTILKDQLQNILPWIIGSTGNYETIVFGAILVLVLETAPNGLWPLIAGAPAPPKLPEVPAADLAQRAKPAPGTPLLAVNAARKTFGGLVAVNDISFQVAAGEILGLIGPNGAGKSTTFDLLTCVTPLTGGTIAFCGAPLAGGGPQDVARRGISRTFQHVHLAPDMSVIENVALGAHLRGSAGTLARLPAARPQRGGRAAEQCETTVAARRTGRAGASARRQFVARAIAAGRDRARALSRSRAFAARRARRRIARRRKEGARAPLTRIAQRGNERAACRARHGLRHEPRRPARRARFRPEDRARHTGRSPPRSARARSLSRRRRMSDVLLSVGDMHVSYGRVEAVHGVSLDVPKASIVTVIGANGAGKTTLLNAIMGVMKGKGRIELDGKPVADLSLEARVANGLCLVPERRELFASMPVEDNLLLGGFRRSRPERTETLDEVYGRFPRLRERRRQLAGTLSGGERQMLAMGRALMARPRLLMLDEPSLGLAPRIVRDVFHIITGLKEAGVSILLVEQNARAALQIASYAYVLELGKVTAAGSSAEITDNPRLVESYLGLGGASY